MSNLIIFDDEKKELIRKTIAKNLSADQFELFMNIAVSRGLDPVLNQIHASVHKDKDGNRIMTPIVGIDGFRKIAHRTNIYAGRSEAEFTYEKNQKYPSKVKVTVFKIVSGEKAEFTATAKWDEYLPSLQSKQFMWKKMPETMLEKCCEVKALRMAFPSDLSGLYVEEEMEQAQGIKDVTPKNESFLPVKKNHDGLVQAFMGLAVSKTDILRRYCIEETFDLTDENVEELRAIYTEIKNGEKSKDEFFMSEGA